MEQVKELGLLKDNFKKVELKFNDFFKNATPRWPGEEHDLLRNHHKNLDSLPIKTITFDGLAVTSLPDAVLKELALAFEAFKNGKAYE